MASHMDMSLDFDVSFQLEWIVALVSTLISLALCLHMRWAAQKAAAQASKGAAQQASHYLILPLYEPILWLATFIFAVRMLLLVVPGPLPTPPSWYSGSLEGPAPVGDGPAAAAQLLATDTDWLTKSMMYFMYWALFEFLNEGVAVFFVFKSPSANAIGEALKAAVLLSLILAVVTTVAFNAPLLQMSASLHVTLDCIFVAAPCALHLVLATAPLRSTGSTRRAPAAFALFNLVWRTLTVAALTAGVYNSALGAVLKVVRAAGTPLAIYAALAGDSRYWLQLQLGVLQSHRARLQVDMAEGDEEEGVPLVGVHYDTPPPSPALPHASPPRPRSSSVGRVAQGTGVDGGGALPPRGGGLKRTSSTGRMVGSRRRPDVTLVVSRSPVSRSPVTRRRAVSGTQPTVATGAGGGGGGVLHRPLLHSPESTRSTQSGALPRGPGLAILPQHLTVNQREVLGRGAGSVVYSGKLGGQPVAVKRIEPVAFTEETLATHHSENFLLGALDHPCIVAYYGMCVQPPYIDLVFPRAQCGSLWDYLRRRDITLTTQQRLTMALDAARALAYLHGLRPAPLVHRDVKSPNFLVTGEGHLLLSDFGQTIQLPPPPLGLARAQQEGGYVPTIPPDITGTTIGTDGWVAPEVLEGKPYGTPADIHSLGIVLWEIWTGSTPFKNIPQEGMLAAVTGGVRPPVPRGAPPQLAALLRACWAPDPALRPPAREVCTDLVKAAKALGVRLQR